MANRKKSFRKLGNLFKARFPLVYIPTWEEDRAISMIKSVAVDKELIKTVRTTYIWAQTSGFMDEEEEIIPNTTDPVAAFNFINKLEEDAIFIFKDFHVYFGSQNRNIEHKLIRKIRDTVPTLKNCIEKKNIIFLSPELNIPDDLQKEIYVFEFPLPSVNEIKDKLFEMLETNSTVKNNLSDEDEEKIAKAAMGLTLQEAENAFALAMVEDGKMGLADIPIILEEKNQVIKKSEILEFVKSDLNINDIGGLQNLKRWLSKRNNSWLDSAKKYNIPAPKGVLITGVPGCGKSLTAKAMSTIWQLPLLKLDMGKIFSGIVGSSEENIRKALKTAEAVAPSILWIDEIEKGLSGYNGTGDSGTSARIFGTFLTWLQDKTAPVFVIATANNISNLPPELLRKGRFDEIFFVDLPTHKERMDIFEVHLNKKLLNQEIAKDIIDNEGNIPKGFLKELADMTEGFGGAEIEQIIIASLYEAFFYKRNIQTSDITNVIRKMVPLSVTQKEQIKGLRDWARLRAVAATEKEALVDYSAETEDNSDDINHSRGGRRVDF